MMKAKFLRLLALCSFSALGACAGETLPGSAGPGVEISIAPLTLPNVLGVEYALAVFNASPATPNTIFNFDGSVNGYASTLVWQQNSVTSNQYGNGPGGDVSYVGPCDADVNSGMNWVALALKQVNVGESNSVGLGSEIGLTPFGPATANALNVLDDQNTAFTGTAPNDLDPDFNNPSPYNAPYILAFDCNENEDTSVVFNLTVMRGADQGFFDIAVNFEDIFCSMKIDSCYDGTTPIELLFNEEGDKRVETAILAAACSAGTGAGNTVMWMAPLTVTCTASDTSSVVFKLDPTGDTVAGNWSVDDVESNYYLNGANYWGQEDLLCDSNSCKKEYWNVAINLDDLRDQGLKNCTVKTAVTASSTSDTSPPQFINGRLSGRGQSYGFVQFNAALTDASAAPTCFQGPMGSGYAETKYGTTRDLNSGKFPQLCYSYTQGAATTPVALEDVTVAGDDYFQDLYSDAETGHNVGTVTANADNQGENLRYKNVTVVMEGLGQSVAADCESSEINWSEAATINTAWNVSGASQPNLTWRAFERELTTGGVVQALVPSDGQYKLSSYRYAGDDWAAFTPAINIDFTNRTIDGGTSMEASVFHTYLTTEQKIPNSAINGQYAFVISRTDSGTSSGNFGLSIGFEGSNVVQPAFPEPEGPAYIFAICSNATQDCYCGDTSGDVACPNPLPADTYWQ